MELFKSVLAGNMFGISVFFTITLLMLNLKLIIHDQNIKPLLKLLILLVILLSAFPYPHSRYLIWLLVAIVAFADLHYSFPFTSQANRPLDPKG